MCKERYRGASVYCDNCARSADLYRQSLYRCWLLSGWYCHGLTLVGVPAYLVRRLQSVLNALARLNYPFKRSDHNNDALVSLHWLRVPERIQYKIAVLT